MAKAKVFLLCGIFASLLASTMMAYELLALWFTDMASASSTSEATSHSQQIIVIALVATQAVGAILLSRFFIVNRTWNSILAWSPVFLAAFAALTGLLIALIHYIAAVG